MMNAAKLIDGKAYAAGLRARVGDAVADLKEQHELTPGLAVVLVGDDPASQIYVGSKGKMTLSAGMNSYEHRLAENTSEATLIELVESLNEDPKVHGILVQLPLPEQINTNRVINCIDPDKDVDGLTVINAGRLSVGEAALTPCTPLGCLMLLRDQLGELRGLHAVIVGRSNLVGKPLAQLLLADHCTVTICHSRTRDLAEVCRQADILVAAVGQKEMIRGTWVKPGATVIDVGINRIPTAAGKSRLIGDVAFDEAAARAGAITPVPGGVGPMTVACLLANTVTAACRQKDLPVPAALTV